jgi:hypothetical protein
VGGGGGVKEKTMAKRLCLLLLSGCLLLLVGCGKETPTVPGGEVAAGEFYVDIYVPETCDGTTLLSDTQDQNRPRVVEVDMQGKIVWEYVIPDELRSDQFVGLDAELLQNGNILLALGPRGLNEIDREGKTLWSHQDSEASHDADRLPNGNTIYVFGNDDQKSNPQVKEVDPQGKLIWSWYTRDHYDVEPYSSIYIQGWTHTNAVTRLKSGNTLINLRNFSLTAEVDRQGNVV